MQGSFPLKSRSNCSLHRPPGCVAAAQQHRRIQHYRRVASRGREMMGAAAISPLSSAAAAATSPSAAGGAALAPNSTTAPPPDAVAAAAVPIEGDPADRRVVPPFYSGQGWQWRRTLRFMGHGRDWAVRCWKGCCVRAASLRVGSGKADPIDILHSSPRR